MTTNVAYTGLLLLILHNFLANCVPCDWFCFQNYVSPAKAGDTLVKHFAERNMISILRWKLVSDAALENHALVTCSILKVKIQFCLANYRGSKGLGRNWYHYHSSSFVTLLLFEQVKASRSTDPTHMSFKYAMSGHMHDIFMQAHTQKHTSAYNKIYLTSTHIKEQMCVINISASITCSH